MPPPANYTSRSQQAGQAVEGLGNNLNKIFVGLAQLRNQQELHRQQLALQQLKLQMEQTLNQTHSQLYSNQAAKAIAEEALARANIGKVTAETGALTTKEKAGEELAGLMTRRSDNSLTSDDRAVVDKSLAGVMARLAAAGVKDIPKAIAQIQGIQGDASPYARALGLGNAGDEYVKVGQDQVAISPTTGQSITGPVKLSEDQANFAGTVNGVPIGSGALTPNAVGLNRPDLSDAKKLATYGNIFRAGHNPMLKLDPNSSEGRFYEAAMRAAAQATGAPGTPNPATGTVNPGVATPQSKAEFDLLPKGSKYINPADGKIMIKTVDGLQPTAQPVLSQPIQAPVAPQQPWTPGGPLPQPPPAVGPQRPPLLPYGPNSYRPSYTPIPPAPPSVVLPPPPQSQPIMASPMVSPGAYRPVYGPPAPQPTPPPLPAGVEPGNLPYNPDPYSGSPTAPTAGPADLSAASLKELVRRMRASEIGRQTPTIPDTPPAEIPSVLGIQGIYERLFGNMVRGVPELNLQQQQAPQW